MAVTEITLARMGAYEELLEATIGHLEGQRVAGRLHVAVSADKLGALFNAPPAAKADPVERAPAVVGASSGGLEALGAKALACVKCPNLVSSRTQVVFGVGNPTADLMFVGEAPGADEDKQGEPFVGAAGQLLTKMLKAMGLSRGDVYIANILKCRPDTPGQAKGNRTPTSGEMATCVPWLHEQIDLIGPKVLVALGKTAVGGLLEKEVAITRFRGQWQEYRGIPLMPTFHPAYLLHNQSLTAKRQVWEDLLGVMARLDMSISEKQRGFFLRGIG
jgi:uracil-DNA glycosylase family 4